MPKPGELTFVAPRGAKKPPRHLADLTPAERKEVVAGIGEKPFRAKQLSQHYFARYAHDPAEWTDIPAGARGKLQEALLPELMTVVRHLSTDQGTTRKTLWRLFDGTLVESVLMRYPDRVTMCISSQAGCGMNCPFCATGQAGLDRNLSTAEIVHQIVDGMRALRDGEVPGGRRGSPTSSSWGWANRSPTTSAWSAPFARSPIPRPMGSVSPSAASPCRPWGSCPPFTGSPTKASSAGSRSPCTRPTTSCATPSSP